MFISRQWSMPSKWTFDVKPIWNLLMKYKVGDGCDSSCLRHSETKKRQHRRCVGNTATIRVGQ